MYRIEVAPGEETVFRTIEELAIGIRNGVITHRSRIYHAASQKWLPIGLHPHYKKALDMPAASIAQTPVTSATPIPTARPKGHSPEAHTQPAPPPPQQKRSPEPRPVTESKPAPKASAMPKIPAPVQSPVIAMQNEVLRDLPVVSIPEPLPWHMPAPESAEEAIELRAPEAHAPGAQALAVLAPPTTSYAPPEVSKPVAEHRNEVEDEEPQPRPTARRGRRMGGHPLLLLGGAAALVICTHLVLTATPTASADPPETPAPAARTDEAERLPETAAESDAPAARTGAVESRAADVPRVTVAPARVPMTPGPAFAGSVPARPGADSARSATTAASAPAPAPASASVLIAPAPAAIELALPDLAPDSVIASKRAGDTLGMKKILRALNGPKPAEAPASQ